MKISTLKKLVTKKVAEPVPVVKKTVAKSVRVKVVPAPKKTVARKVVTKKAAIKKTVTKKAAVTKKVISSKPPLVVTTNDTSFWMNDGQILNSLVALQFVLSTMDSAVYHYHTANKRNDFADWVDDVLGDAACAAALRKAKTAKTAATVVLKHLTAYQY